MKSKSKGKDFCIFALPGLFCFFAVVIVPFIYGVYLTMTDWNGVSDVKNFIGLQNFAGVMKDGQFWSSLLLTFKYVIVVVVFVNVLAFMIAYLLTRGIKGQNFFRAGFFTPNLIGGIVLGYIWQFVFSRVFVGIGDATGWGLFEASWLSEPTKAFIALVIVTVWQLSGYMILIYVAGFMGLSDDVMEAATIDGASGWTKMKSIIMPLMMSSITICLFLTLSRAFMVYDVNLSLTAGVWCGPGRGADPVRDRGLHQRHSGLFDQEEGGGSIMAGEKAGSGKKRKNSELVATAGLIVIFILYMFPFYMVVINSLKQKRDIIKSPFSWLYTIKGLSFDNFVKAFVQMDFLNAFKNSLIVTVFATALVTLLAAMLAYYIVRNNNAISRIAFVLMVASMIIPFQAIMIPLVSIYGGKLNALNHRSTLVFMHTGFSMAMSVFMFHGFIKGNVPVALEEAANIDGCTHVQTFFRIVFPLLKPIISTMVILNSLAFWNDFLLPSLVLSDKKLLTLPLSTYSFYGTYSADYGTIMAGLLLCVIPVLILYITLQKQIISGVVAGAVK